MVLTAYNWDGIQNLYLQYLGAKMTVKSWISTLTRKLWDKAWYVWNHQNHTLHSTDGPMKFEILRIIGRIVSHYLKKISIGLPLQRHFIFHTLNQYLITHPALQHLLWLAAASSTIRCSRSPSQSKTFLDDDEPLPGRISMGRLIPSLYQVEEAPALWTTVGPTLTHSLFL